MKIVCLREDYVDYLYENLEKIHYPFKNSGFNLSFASIDNKRELYSIRLVITLKSLFNKNDNKGNRYVPGINPGNKTILKNDFYAESDFSEKFIWSWKNFYEVCILFVGSLQKNGHIKINRSIKPKSLMYPYYIYNLPKIFSNSIPPSFRLMRREDFRVYKIKKKLFIMDSAINTLSEVKVENNNIILDSNKLSKYKGICEYDEEKIAENKKKGEEKYYKIFEKNWSLYKFQFENKIPTFYFLHDYSDQGIEIVKYNKHGCKKELLIKYKGDEIPHKNDGFVRFSFGSTIAYHKGYYYGVGHTKYFVKKNKDEIDEKFYRLKDFTTILHKNLRKIFKSKYKVHPNKMYAYYFFRYHPNKKEFLISDSFIPIYECNEYIFSLCFPMSIVNKYNNFYISMGYGDYTNIMASYTIDELDNTLIHNVANFDLSNYKLTISYSQK